MYSSSTSAMATTTSTTLSIIEDKIDLSAFGLSGFDDLVLFSDSFGVTTVDLSAYGGGTIKLFEFDIANLDATDFLF